MSYQLNSVHRPFKGVESKILREQQWQDLRGADVFVTTPMGSSPARSDVPHPSHDLFDLLLVDEAHHSPARTWAALIAAFPQSRQVLFGDAVPEEPETPARTLRVRIPVAGGPP